MLFKLTLGSHRFPKAREVFDAKGKSKGQQVVVNPGDIFDISDDEHRGTFKVRGEKFEKPVAAAPGIDENSDVLKGLIYDAKWLEDNKTVEELRAIAKARGCKGYSNAREATLIKKIMDAMPLSEDELAPDAEWSEDRLKGYLEDNECAYEPDADADTLLAIASAHYLSNAG